MIVHGVIDSELIGVMPYGLHISPVVAIHRPTEDQLLQFHKVLS